MIWQSNKSGKDVLLSLEKDRLTSIRYFKALQIEKYFQHLVDDLSNLSNNYEVINALQDFSTAFPKYLSEAKGLHDHYKSHTINKYLEDFNETYKYYNLGKEINAENFVNLISENSFALQYNYIFNNKYDFTHKEDLTVLKDGSSYSIFHEKYHKILRDAKKKFGFYDIFLVNGATGDIVYTVNKEVDFTTSLIKGPYANSGLGKVFEKLMKSDQEDFIAVADFAPYLAFYDNQAAFIGSAIFNAAGKKIGTIIIQLSITNLNKIMTDSDLWQKIGPGKTLNANIIGPDYTLRNNNRFIEEDPKQFVATLKNNNIDSNIINLIKVKNSTIGILKHDNIAAKSAFEGKEGFIEYQDYRQIPVVSSFSPLNIPGFNWVMEITMDKEEALMWATKLKNTMLYHSIWVILVAGIIAICLSAVTANLIIQVIQKITTEINNITRSKDLTKRLTAIENSEFSVMINALNNFITGLQHNLSNIVISSHKSKVQSKQPQQVDQSQPVTGEQQELFDLYDQIKNLSEEFKILEEQHNKSKYW
jgi:methyl-accepting chemotaxis protein